MMIRVDDMSQLRRMLRRLDKVEALMARRYGDEVLPGSTRSVDRKDAKALRAVIEELDRHFSGTPSSLPPAPPAFFVEIADVYSGRYTKLGWAPGSSCKVKGVYACFPVSRPPAPAPVAKPPPPPAAAPWPFPPHDHKEPK